VHKVAAPLSSNSRIQSDGHGNWIGQRDAILSGLDFIGVACVRIALDRKSSEDVIEAQNLRDVALVQDCVGSAQMPSDQFYRHAAVHDDARSLGINPDVVFGGWRDVSFTTRSPSHHHAAANLRGNARLL